MKTGYIRVSTQEQNTIRQEVLMESLGVDEVYIDRMSGKNTNRPELQKMMEYVRKGDTVIVESISRFARNTRDLLELVEKLTAKGVEFVSKKEAIDTTTPTGKFMLTVFGAVAELEREYILQRQREGIAIAKDQGKYKGRKPIQVPEFEQVIAKWRNGTITAAEAINVTNSGTNANRIISTTITATKGQMTTFVTGTRAMPAAMNSCRPTGGVMVPIRMVIIMMIAKWMGSSPTVFPMGNRTGTKIIIATVPSKNSPTIKRMPITISRISVLLAVMSSRPLQRIVAKFPLVMT